MNVILEMFTNTWTCQSHMHFLILSIPRPHGKSFMACQTSHIDPGLFLKILSSLKVILCYVVYFLSEIHSLQKCQLPVSMQ